MMEYEIDDDPQGERDEDLGDRDGGIIEDHSALKNQSSVKPEDYPRKDRQAERLDGKKK